MQEILGDIFITINIYRSNLFALTMILREQEVCVLLWSNIQKYKGVKGLYNQAKQSHSNNTFKE